MYRKSQIAPEFENKFYENGLNPEQEWSSVVNTVKKYASPFFNWIAGPSVPSTPSIPSTPAKPVSEAEMVKNAIAGGDRNENSLTEKVFSKRHPELGGKPLTKSMLNFSTLSKEWLTIRDTIVRPLLGKPAAPASPPGYTPGPSQGTTTGSGKVNLQDLLNALSRKKYVLYSKPYQLNIVGVRTTNAQSNSFDDTINVFYQDNFGNWQFKSNPATTDPGTYYLNNPMNVSGTAIVVPGQYINSHKIGLHRSSYTALVQQGPLKVIRDTNRDNILDFNSSNVITGTYGINIHKAGSNSTAVDKWSAGCQVFARSADFDEFIKQCQQHSQLHGNNFTYTLLEEKDLYS